MAFTVAQGRTEVRNNLRSNGFDTSLYTDTLIDWAISDAGEELVRETTLLRTTGTATLAAGSLSITPASLPTGLRPDRLTNVYLTGSNVQVTLGAGIIPPYFVVGAPVGPVVGGNRAVLELLPFTTVLERSYATRDLTTGVALTGQPQAFAFQNLSGTNMFFPTADAAYIINFEWNKLFTNWTIGGSGTENFLLPDDYMIQVLRYGAPSKIQFNEPGNAYARMASEKWALYIRSMASKGDYGEQVAQRGPANRADSGLYNNGMWPYGG